MEQNKTNTALLVMDMQTAILRNLPQASETTKRVTKAIAHARELKIPVIYIRVGFRKNTPEINMKNKGFASGKERFTSVSPDDFLIIAPALAPLENDIVVTKRRVSAFTGSDLEVILRAQAIQHIILTGVSSSGVVLSTVREAADKDYLITILSDCCADADPEVHNVLMTKIFPRQATVCTLEEWHKM